MRTKRGSGATKMVIEYANTVLEKNISMLQFVCLSLSFLGIELCTNRDAVGFEYASRFPVCTVPSKASERRILRSVDFSPIDPTRHYDAPPIMVEHGKVIAACGSVCVHLVFDA